MKVVFILLLFAFAKEIESLGLHNGAGNIKCIPSLLHVSYWTSKASAAIVTALHFYDQNPYAN